MRGDDIDLDEMLGPDPVAELPENLIEEQPPGYRPMGAAGRALLERSRSYPVPGNGRDGLRKNTPERLKRCIAYAKEMPVLSDVARRAGVSPSSIKYWLQKSFEGAPGDGFDLSLGDDDENGTPENTVRFHEEFDAAMMAGVERVEAATIRRATGYDEVLTYQGRVQYKYDPVKMAQSRALDMPELVPENYLLDEAGVPVPETVYKMDPDLAMFILKTRKAQVYGQKATMDVNIRGGVLVVPMKAVAAADLNAAEEQFRKLGRPNVTFEEGDDEDDNV